jgi:hypothetical protein
VSWIKQASPDAELRVVTPKQSSAAGRDSSDLVADAVRELVKMMSGRSWDLILDASGTDLTTRFGFVWELSPYLTPNGCYVLAPNAAQRGGPLGDEVLDAMSPIMAIVHGRYPFATSDTGLRAANPPSDRSGVNEHNYFGALFDRIEILDSAVVLHRNPVTLVARPPFDYATSNLFHWAQSSGAHDVTEDVEAESASTRRQYGTSQQRKIAALSSELHRLTAALARRDRDVLALEEERSQLGDALQRGRHAFLPHTIARRIANTPRAFENRMRDWSAAKFQTLIASPRIRAQLQRVRNLLH